ncbi:MAG: tripartite tricarboxylate transporter substrate binding protein [Rhodocyclaceae bacterium]|nr:tripartite tricarboxylate transporter substrate binding protein [Rhodocyclaceae bacterium]MCA3076004.1 tripartite tricarboxylate transporter substrate binding protein [Rhodocyclaceae bacterium]MCA3090200.1 tripartite tricarboxylate transporter substrate binding protein [Rhodocyclaceae bacterium]MCA3093796.1 tripartite tricarboxylate transporter substrate binding protein [Rhodocyclaceae bacterium]MCA3098839.1 tripartite tricarboxylate transporter substrate binding protein [Rhodocyclaceae bact
MPVFHRARSLLAAVSCTAAFALALAGPVQAQPAWPAKPVRLVAGFAPGGISDILARVVGARLGDALGQPVLVENRAGAGGTIGADFVAKSAPDGYTLFLGVNATQSIAPSLYPKLPYNPATDFAPITIAAVTPVLLVTHPSLPVKSVKDLIAIARAQPGQLNYASTGTGALPHLTTELFSLRAGVKMNHVPYKGGAPAMMDLVAGQVSLMFDNIPTAIAQVRANKVRALAVAQAKRTPAAADIPTMAESGFPGFEVLSWQGFLAPAGTPGAVVNRLNADILKVLAQPDVRERLTAQGIEIRTSTPAEFAAIIRADAEIWAKVVKATGTKIE